MSEHEQHPHGGFDPGETPQEVTARTGSHYEHTDARSRALIIFIVGVLISLALIAVGVGVFGMLLYVRHRAATRPPSELMTRAQPFPEPRLQSSPRADMARMLAEEDALLTGYGWVDRKAGLVRIPIARAIDLIAQHGLPPKRTDIPTTAGAYAAAQAAAAGAAATNANIRAAQTVPPTGLAPTPKPSPSPSPSPAPSPRAAPSPGTASSMRATTSTASTPPARNTPTTTTRKAGP